MCAKRFYPKWEEMSPAERAWWRRRKTVFFDIDGTLIDAHGAGRASFAAALEKATDNSGLSKLLDQISFDGNSDANVLRALEKMLGWLFSFEVRRRFWAAFEADLEERLFWQPPEELGGAREFVVSLIHRDVHLGVITGNCEAGARLKLHCLPIAEHWIEFGGYGDALAAREDIARAAVEAARVCRAAVDADSACVVGDTPTDLAGARAVGLPFWGVAGGRFSAAELRAAGADGAWG